MRLIKKIKIEATIEVITGLHIGGNSENVEIGGIDNAVIKLATRGNQPYIPGSSIKGKMRCLLEQSRGANLGGNTDVNKVFGWAKGNSPSRIIVRDALLTDDSVEQFQNNTTLDMPYTESKWENVIDRVSGTAEHPRQTERVPAGAKFSMEIILNVWDDDNEGMMLDILREGKKLLENDYLGGSGSRGYGQIRFTDWKENTAWKNQ